MNCKIYFSQNQTYSQTMALNDHQAFSCFLHQEQPLVLSRATSTHKLKTSRPRQEAFIFNSKSTFWTFCPITQGGWYQEGWCGPWDCQNTRATKRHEANSRDQGNPKWQISLGWWWWEAMNATLLVWRFPAPHFSSVSIFWLCKIPNSENTVLWCIRDPWSTAVDSTVNLLP